MSPQASHTPLEEPTIPIISVGIHRLPTLSATLREAGTPYRVTAFLDFDPTTTPAAYQYSAHNLAVLLYNLHPRPRALLTGTAVLWVPGREGIVEEVRAVWDKYARDVLEKDGEGRGYCIPVGRSLFRSYENVILC